MSIWSPDPLCGFRVVPERISGNTLCGIWSLTLCGKWSVPVRNLVIALSTQY
jgi:hypothetical protein